MDLFSLTLVVLGLFLFETISSIDNAIINAQVLGTMGEKAKRWFLTWGLFFAVFVVRGLLPWLIVWLSVPGPVSYTHLDVYKRQVYIKNDFASIFPRRESISILRTLSEIDFFRATVLTSYERKTASDRECLRVVRF